MHSHIISISRRTFLGTALGGAAAVALSTVVPPVPFVTTPGIAEQLVEGARSAEDLAKAVGAHAPSLERVLRALASVGVFAQRADGRFHQTPASACLLNEVPGSLQVLTRRGPIRL